MPRQARVYSAGEYLHIMMRGINRQDIFEDDEDRGRFLSTLKRFAGETGTEILAWCLMSNHVHMLVRRDGPPDTFVKRIGCSYVPYFNQKTGRSGHLFQDRYRSENISDDRYLLAVVRYIHMNPEKAGICRMADYRWSSYAEYLGDPEYASTGLVLELLSGKDGFREFMNTADPREFMDDRHGLSEREAAAAARELLPSGPLSVQRMPKADRNAAILRLRDAGLTAAQICRITGLGKTIVYGVIK